MARSAYITIEHLIYRSCVSSTLSLLLSCRDHQASSINCMGGDPDDFTPDGKCLAGRVRDPSHVSSENLHGHRS